MVYDINAFIFQYFILSIETLKSFLAGEKLKNDLTNASIGH